LIERDTHFEGMIERDTHFEGMIERDTHFEGIERDTRGLRGTPTSPLTGTD
jgi:hypothetical protein